MRPGVATTLDAAQAYLQRGCSVIPIRPRDKKPLIPWKDFQVRHPTEHELKDWFDGTENNVGIVAGKISNLTIVDCDSPEAIEYFVQAAPSAGNQ